jgi:integrase
MLTDIAIKALIAPANLPASRRETPDGKVAGLFFITQPSGATSWALRYRAEGASRKLTLGSFPALDLKAARRKAEDERGKIARGEDPVTAKQASRAAAKAEREGETDLVEKVVEKFVERYAKAQTRDWRETERLLEKNAVEKWRGRRLSSITPPQIHDLLDEITDRGAPIAANRVLAQLKVLGGWAVERGIIEKNPFEGVKAPASEKGRARERVLGDVEVRLVWNAADSIGWPFGPIVKLLLLTGSRRDEVAQMEWRELDLERALWTLPASRSKNRREHAIPLSDTAVDVLRSLPRLDRSELVFTTNGRTPVSGFSKAKPALDRAMAELAGEGASPIPGWVLHDLRRTVATNLQQLGVRLEVTEAVLNHVSGSRAGIVGVYQKHDYAAEKRHALDAWALMLEEVVVGSSAEKLKAMRERVLPFVTALKGDPDERCILIDGWKKGIDAIVSGAEASNVVPMQRAEA